MIAVKILFVRFGGKAHLGGGQLPKGPRPRNDVSTNAEKG